MRGAPRTSRAVVSHATRASGARLRRVFPAIGLATLVCSTPLPAQGGGASSERDAVVPISAALCQDMKSRNVLKSYAPIGCDRLRLVRFDYVGFDGSIRTDGEMVLLDAVADHVLWIFVTLRGRKFPIAGASLMNRYDGDDDASMADNNTSAFNVRPVEGSRSMSLHAYGVAIDLNPIQNPYVARSAQGPSVSPPAGAAYLNRKTLRPGMAETVVDVFAQHGFVWGGYWRNPDYQHFQLSRSLAGRLVRLPSPQARALFERHVERARACIQAARQRGEPTARSCMNL